MNQSIVSAVVRSVTSGQIDSGTGVFTPPPISEPCTVTVAGGGVSASEAVTITDPSPETSGCGVRRNFQRGNEIKAWSNCLSDSG